MVMLFWFLIISMELKSPFSPQIILSLYHSLSGPQYIEFIVLVTCPLTQNTQGKQYTPPVCFLDLELMMKVLRFLITRVSRVSTVLEATLFENLPFPLVLHFLKCMTLGGPHLLVCWQLPIFFFR